MRLPRRSPVPVTVLALALLAAVGSSRAQADTLQETEHPVAVAVPSTELRLVGGLGVGLEAAKSLLGDRLRLDAGLHGWLKRAFGEGATLVRVLGSAANGLWLRVGLLYQRTDIGCGVTDNAAALDAGLAYRKRWAGGSLFTAEGGAEKVARGDRVHCNDSGLAARSNGVRFSIGGQYALRRGLSLYARIGVRTGQHVMEIGFLPELWAGVAFEF